MYGYFKEISVNSLMNNNLSIDSVDRYAKESMELGKLPQKAEGLAGTVSLLYDTNLGSNIFMACKNRDEAYLIKIRGYEEKDRELLVIVRSNNTVYLSTYIKNNLKIKKDDIEKTSRDHLIEYVFNREYKDILNENTKETLKIMGKKIGVYINTSGTKDILANQIKRGVNRIKYN